MAEVVSGRDETTMITNPLDLTSSDDDIGRNSETSTSMGNGDILDERAHHGEEVNIDISKDNSLIVDISDALSERDKVKYTVHTRTTLPDFAKSEVSVVREHEEFIWLHTCLEENEAYAGFIIPPAPPRPDFDASREKLQRLGESESTMTKDEFLKMKQELEQEYLATFKKTVAMHEVFLCRLAAHPVFRNDSNFRIFLEYEQDLSVRAKNTKELVGSFWKRLTQSADEVLLSGQKDVDDFFEHERNYLVEYYTHVKEASLKCDRISRLRKNVADSYSRIGLCLEKMAQQELDREMQKDFIREALIFEKLKKHESRVATDEELKLGDTLQYYMKDTDAAKDLLYRRMRCLANYEGANKTLERARGRNKDIPKAEAEQSEACKKFEDISEVARDELLNLKKRRLISFKKNLTDLADLQIKHAKAQIALLEQALSKQEY
ncbi:Sorting nexin-6 [Dirofilaria immitis]